MLRVIGGKAKGRFLKVPKGSRIRPTSDKVRESLFNIIPPSFIEGKRFMELFAGTGAVGIEALSRGASHVTFIESNPGHSKMIYENLELCDFKDSAEVICADVLKSLDKYFKEKPGYDIVFIDPPYNFPKWKILLPKVSTNVSIFDYGFLIFEHLSKVSINTEIEDFSLYGKYIYGDTTLTVYRKLKVK